jgi:hypothetical protein
VILSHDFGKSLRTIFAGKNQVTHGGYVQGSKFKVQGLFFEGNGSARNLEL